MAIPTAQTAPAWRQFSFFDVVPVKDIHDLASPPEIFHKTTPEISTIASSSIGVLVADIHGSIHVLDKDFETVQSWVVHVGGRVTHMIERNRVLVTLGEEDNIRYPLLKIWALDKVDKKTGAPNLLRSTKVQLSTRPHPVTTVALSRTLSHLAIGLGDGTVLLYRHLDQSIFSGSANLTALPKPRIVHESPTEPITGLGFREPSAEDNGHNNVYLFVVTTNHVLSYHASGRGAPRDGVGAMVVVDEVGCALGCATMDWRARDVVVSRDEAIYICGPEGRGACYAYEGHKSSVQTHLNYLVIVSPPFLPSASAASATVRNFVSNRTNTNDGQDITKVTVFDLENKFVAYSGTFALHRGVRSVISAWGNVYVLENDGNLSCLKEKPTTQKLEMLYSKSHFLLALNLAKTQRLDESSVADIHRRYGDHLYAKADYDGAMQQFVQTIGWLQPSYVIRKFLDAQRIHNLVTYLQELHSLGRANSDHTTLLLNTYTKLKDVARLDSFIKTEGPIQDGQDARELPFDLDTAIRVCRQAGYFDHASYLAKRYERHEDYLRIQIEDAGRFGEALEYLRRLGPEAAEANLARYGRAMLSSLPEETTQLLIDICTSSLTLPHPKLDTTSEVPSPITIRGAPSYLSYLALNRAAPAPPEATVPTPPSPSIKTVRQGDTAADESRSSSPPLQTPIAAPAAPSPIAPVKARIAPPVKCPSPRLYFAHFVDHMENFVVFLEAVARRRWGQSVDGSEPEGGVKDKLVITIYDAADKQDQVAVWNTLLELYLTLPDSPTIATASKGGKASLRAKALNVLQSSTIPYDPTHALILCSSWAYTPGLVLLWERMGMYEDVLRFWMDKGDPTASKEVIRYLNLYGPAHPHLYPLVLRFLTSTSELLARHREDVGEILKRIDEGGMMPPLGVVQVLSRNGCASVGMVKEWLMGRIREEREEIETDQRLIASYRLETAAKLKQVQELSDPDSPRVFHVTRCSSCGGQLDLPSVHFMCNHSYHQRCIADHDPECPNCARDHGVIREIRRNNERLADQHELFLAEVKEDGFKAVAGAFGRGVLNVPRVDV